jgi:hypothetical protein
MPRTNYPEHVAPTTCPMCGGTEFGEEEGRIGTKWAANSTHLVKLYVCTGCAHVMTYYLKRSGVG